MINLKLIPGGKKPRTRTVGHGSTAALIGKLKQWMRAQLHILTGGSRLHIPVVAAVRSFLSLAALSVLVLTGGLLILVIILSLVSCSAASKPQRFVDQRYTVNTTTLSAMNPQELIVYYDLFLIEAANRGIDTRKFTRPRFYFAHITERGSNDEMQVAALCKTDANMIIINTPVWVSKPNIMKEMIVLHEIGHCVLRRGHKEDCLISPRNGECVEKLSIMTGLLIPELLPYTQKRKEYLDELFNYRVH